jgi:hypothetical protein
MTPEAYSERYLKMAARLEDFSVSEVRIDRYLNAGAIYSKEPKVVKGASPRSKRAQAAYGKLYEAIRKELKIKSLPLTFKVGGIVLGLLGVKRCFDGKGSPPEIRHVLWLASRYGQLSWETAQAYCDANLGLDCNGFAANYWGMIPDKVSTWDFDKNARKNFDDIQNGDAIVFYKTLPKSPKPNCSHVAVVGGDPSVSGNKLTFDVVQSAGNELGLHTDFGLEWVLKRDKSGSVYSEEPSSERRYRFFAAGPAKQDPR